MNSQITNSKGQYINGQWRKEGNQTFNSSNPATGSVFWQGEIASDSQVDMAFDAANKAKKSWARLSFNDRCQFAEKFARIVNNKKEELAKLISIETGKPYWESLTEAGAVVSKISLSISAYNDRTATSQTKQNDLTSSLRYKPHGIVAVLGAFNFPAHLSNGHIVPALIAGNTVLYKPSELTPAVAEFIMECWHETEIPNGVINCIQGSGDCGKALLNQKIQGVYFTGSYKTGLAIHKSFADKPEVILALEMGGNNPLVIGEVNDIKAAVYNSLISGFITAGQRCTCSRRVIVPDNAYGDEYLKSLIQATKNIKVGSFQDNPEPFIGPVISSHAALNHIDSLNKLKQAGGESIVEMELLKENTGFLSPGIIDMSKVQTRNDEEIFAPLIQIYRYQTFDEAIKKANDSKYGLSAGLLSDDENQYMEFFDEVEAGLINWNRPTTGAAGNLPFGGVGQSGNHRPSAYFAADYCAYPIASQEQMNLSLPGKTMPGIGL